MQMKQFMIAPVLALSLGLSAAAAPATSAEKAPAKEEMKMKNQWVQEHLTDAKAKPPFSFVYDGKASDGLLAGWPKQVETKKLDANRTEHTLRWADPKSGLEVRCVAVDYADHPAVEWLLHVTNTGTTNSPIIEKIQALDCNLPGAGKGFVLHRALGEANSERSFAPVDEPLPPGDFRERVYAPNGGRSSDGNMPYFNVDRLGGGMVLAIGWSGQWEAGFQSLADGSLRVRAGQQLTHFTLHAGETVRSPRIVLAFWQGPDDLRGNNLFRQLVLKHYLPQKDGLPVFPPICASTGEVAPDGTYEKPHLDAVARMKDRGVEVFWSDMDPQQWYPGGFPNGTGTWEVDKSKYPNGLKPLGDAIRAAGLGYLLWFEPERVAPGTKIAREHPEWVHGGSRGGLFRFDDAAALKWMIELIDAHVTTAQLTWVRWDFNIEPLGYWRHNDAPDRQGITEIRHMEGLYGMWAELQRRHPGLIIDNCSSGGRRLDIEAGRYGLPLWHSDLQCTGSHPEADQLQNGGLYRWVPMHGCGNFGLEPSYAFRSAMTAGNLICVDNTEEQMKKIVAVYRKLRPYMLGDFYPLFLHSNAQNAWYGYQFNRPEQTDGFALVFRRGQAAEETAVKLRGLDPERVYALTEVDRPGVTNLSGRALMETGLSVKLPPNGSAIILYNHLSAVVVADTRVGEAPLSVRFDGTRSSCVTGKIVACEWNFGDGATARDAVAMHTYEKEGNYTASLTVKNEQGQTIMDRLVIVVTPVDVIAPTITQVVAPGRPDRVRVTFSEPVMQAGAETASNYAITPGIHVLAASLSADRCTVTLTTSPLGALSSPGADYTLSAKGIRDCGRKQNVMAADTRHVFRYSPILARWKLDEGKGLAAADASGSKLDGVLKGAPVWTNLAGRAGLNFDGADDIVEMPTRLESLAVPFTFTLWVNPAAEQMEYANILGNHAGFRGLVMQQDQNKTNLFYLGYGDGSKGYGCGLAQLTAGTWQHVAVVFDGEKAFCYINGEEKSTGSSKGEFAPNMNLTFRLGQGYSEKRFFKGLLSDVRIYRMALSAAEVQKVMKE